MSKTMTVKDLNRVMKEAAERPAKKKKLPNKRELFVPKMKAPDARPPFGVHSMGLDKENRYTKRGESRWFKLVDEVVNYIEREIEEGQGNGLHEIIVHVR